MKVVVLWLINERGEILMARRAAHMSTDAGVWGPSVSGKVDVGETIEQAVFREAREELGIQSNEISPTLLHDSVYAEHSDGKKRTFYFHFSYVPAEIDNRLSLEPNEVSEVKWFDFAKLQKLVHAKSDQVIISSALPVWQSIFEHLRPLTAQYKI